MSRRKYKQQGIDAQLRERCAKRWVGSGLDLARELYLASRRSERRGSYHTPLKGRVALERLKLKQRIAAVIRSNS